MSSYRKCLQCKEVKDKDTHFTIEAWKCDVCLGGGGAAPASTPARDAAPAAPASGPAKPTQVSAPATTPAPAPKAPTAPTPAPAPKAPTAPTPTAPKPAPSSEPTTTVAASGGFVPPNCTKCGGQILGPALDAMGGKFHPECFTCCICGLPITEVDFAIVEGKQAHEACRPKPECVKCKQPIAGMILTALNAKWHETCFVCIKCEKPLAHQKFFIEEDDSGNEVPLCEKCTPKPEPCFSCGQPVDRGIVALDATWHPACFVCGHCKSALDGPFFPKDKIPYCSKECYLAAM
uniref:LIM zinc-binding domain-containing protein n=1 Tax=Eutreptiella gymnastica TaxID=73025 RepID=A0A7S4CF70_9EUGL